MPRSEWDEDTHKMLRCPEHGAYVPLYGRLGGTICPLCPNVFYDMQAEYNAKLKALHEQRIEEMILHGSATG